MYCKLHTGSVKDMHFVCTYPTFELVKQTNEKGNFALTQGPELVIKTISFHFVIRIASFRFYSI